MTGSIEIFQHNLKSIRHFLGFTLGYLADNVGVSRQHISNIERCTQKMTKIQYLALTYLLETDVIPNLSEEDAKIVKEMLVRKVKDCRYGRPIVFED